MGGSSDIGSNQAMHAWASVGNCGPLWSRFHLAKTPLAATPFEPRDIQPSSAFLRFEFCSFRFCAPIDCFCVNDAVRRAAIGHGMAGPHPEAGLDPHPSRVETPVKNIYDQKSRRSKDLLAPSRSVLSAHPDNPATLAQRSTLN